MGVGPDGPTCALVLALILLHAFPDYVYDDVTYVYDDVTHVYDDVTSSTHSIARVP